MRVADPAPEFQAYLGTLWRRKWYVIAVLAAVLAASLFSLTRQTPLYESTSEVLVRPVNFDPTQPASAGGFINMLTEERVGASSAVAKIAADRLGSMQLAQIDASAVEGTQSLLFRAVSADPEAAQATASAFAQAYLEFRRDEVLADLEAASDPLRERLAEIDLELQDVQSQLLGEDLTESERTSLQIRFNSLLSERGSLEARLNELVLPENISVGEVLQHAPFPVAPFSPDLLRTLIFAVFVGISLGAATAFVVDRSDRRIRGRDDLENRLGVSALGVIPSFGSQTRSRAGGKMPLTLSDPDSSVSEAFRITGTRLVGVAAERRAKHIMVTSAKADEGKTTTAANLAVALAQAGKRVVLIEADFQRPRLADHFQARNGVGLVDVLAGRIEVGEVITEVVQNLNVLWTGDATDARQTVFTPEMMSSLLSKLDADADFVLIDSAPLLGVSDSLALAIASDAILVVADARHSERSAIDEVRRLLDRIGTPVVGAVLVNSEPSSFAYYDVRRDRSALPSVWHRVRDAARGLGTGAHEGDGEGPPPSDEAPRGHDPQERGGRVSRDFLAVYDYGQGGVWTLIRAEDADEIRARYPELKVITERPETMTTARLEEIIRSFRKPLDVNDENDPFLKALREGRAEP